MSIVKFKQVNPLLNVNSDIEKLIRGVFTHWDQQGPAHLKTWRPAVDIREDDNRFVVDIELPGLGKDDVTITFKEDSLSVSGERKQRSVGEKGSTHRIERVYGKFQRSFTFPSAVDSDAIEASFKKGVLSITVPKAEEVKPREIVIK